MFNITGATARLVDFVVATVPIVDEGLQSNLWGTTFRYNSAFNFPWGPGGGGYDKGCMTDSYCGLGCRYSFYYQSLGHEGAISGYGLLNSVDFIHFFQSGNAWTGR